MVCIYCGNTTKVTNSRPQKRLHQTWRRRACLQCGAVFTTIESAELGTSLVVKLPDGRVRPFSRDKLLISISRSVGHRQAPAEDAGALTATITAQLLSQTNTAAISPTDIVRITLEILRRFDNAAAVQYGAYHKG